MRARQAPRPIVRVKLGPACLGARGTSRGQDLEGAKMGWLYGWSSRRSLIDHLSHGEETEAAKWATVAKYLSGNVMWVVHDVTRKATGEVTRFIACYLLQRHGGDWGYKDMEESMGPYFYTCPPKFLEMVPVVGCQKWRDGVLAHWKAKRDGAGLAKALAVGERFRSKASGDTFELVRARGGSVIARLVEAKARDGRVMPHVGELYRVKAEHVEVIPVEAQGIN